MRPFSMLRFAAYLLGIVVLCEMIITMLAALTCMWGIALAQTMPIGSCQNLTTQVREIWSELLAGVLALLLAARPPRNGPPDSGGEGG